MAQGLSSLWLWHAFQLLIGRSKFYGEALATLLSCRADRHWRCFRVWRSRPRRTWSGTPIVLSGPLKPCLLRGNSWASGISAF